MGANCCDTICINSLAVQWWAVSKGWQVGVCLWEDDLQEACSLEDGDLGVCLLGDDHDEADGFEAAVHDQVVCCLGDGGRCTGGAQ